MRNLISSKDTTSLMEFLRGTEKIATAALQSLDSTASFRIIPSHDLGIPYDVDRLSGGFPNGVYASWECSIPIVPVDATVNVCTASVFELEGESDNLNFLKNLRGIEAVWEMGSYMLNFNRGNHFIILCEDEEHKKYLVMHSSAKEFTKTYNGLYPVKGNWYYDKIKVFQYDKRYFRYISGHEAEHFCKIAEFLDGFNELRHEQIAESLLTGYAQIKRVEHHHHYGMPDRKSINIGCYLKKKGDVFPIFSRPNCPITLYRVDSSSQVAEDKRYIVPHGWGKECIGDCKIEVDYDKQSLKFNEEEFLIGSNDTFYRSTRLQYRNYINSFGVNTFYDYFNGSLGGQVCKTLYQLIAYTVDGIKVLDRKNCVA